MDSTLINVLLLTLCLGLISMLVMDKIFKREE